MSGAGIPDKTQGLPKTGQEHDWLMLTAWQDMVGSWHHGCSQHCLLPEVGPAALPCRLHTHHTEHLCRHLRWPDGPDGPRPTLQPVWRPCYPNLSLGRAGICGIPSCQGKTWWLLLRNSPAVQARVSCRSTTPISTLLPAVRSVSRGSCNRRSSLAIHIFFCSIHLCHKMVPYFEFFLGTGPLSASSFAPSRAAHSLSEINPYPY